LLEHGFALNKQVLGKLTSGIASSVTLHEKKIDLFGFIFKRWKNSFGCLELDSFLFIPQSHHSCSLLCATHLERFCKMLYMPSKNCGKHFSWTKFLKQYIIYNEDESKKWFSKISSMLGCPRLCANPGLISLPLFLSLLCQETKNGNDYYSTLQENVMNEWLGCLKDYSKVLQEKILLKI